MSRYHKKNISRYRKSHGLYLVETLVATILGALICFVMLDLLSQTLRVTATNANQLSANVITHAVLDSVKSQTFDQLIPGSYPLLVNSTTAGEVSVSGHPLPVGLNIGNLSWTDKAVGNKFPGTVTLDLQAVDLNSINASVTVSWPLSTTGNTKTVATMTKVYRQGANVYGR